VNPTEMSKEVLSAVSQSYELATYSTPELRGLFNDWVGAIEREILGYIKEKRKVNPDEIAEHFRLERGSIIFMLGKLARENKIKMQASET